MYSLQDFALLFFLVLLVSKQMRCSGHPEIELLRNLSVYNELSTLIRPVKDHFQPIQINTTLELMTLHAIDERQQVLKAMTVTSVTWIDETLKWNSSQHGHINRILVPLKNIWTPDLCFSNELNIDKCIVPSDKAKVLVHANGSVKWCIGKEIQTLCDINISKYPFDKQKCPVRIGLGYSTKAEIELLSPLDHVVLHNFRPNEEWELLNTHVDYNKLEGEYDFTEVVYHFILRRRTSFYIFHVVLPIALLGLLNVFCFVLPIESGEKIGMGMAIFLTYAVFMTLISDTVPRSSIHTFWLGIYMSIELLVSGLTIIMEVIILCVYHGKNSILLSIFIRVIRRCKCLRNTESFLGIIKSENEENGDQLQNDESEIYKEEDISRHRFNGQIQYTHAKECSMTTRYTLAKKLDFLCGVLVTIINVVSFIVYIVSVNIHHNPHEK